MFGCCNFCLLLAGLYLAGCTLPVCAQAQGQTGDSILKQRYEAAQKFQEAHDLERAAEQYRIFLADALGEVAIGYAQAGQYQKAEDDFDEALKLVPQFPLIELEYARTALRAGEAEHASNLAQNLLRNYPANAKVQTEAHALLGRAYLKMGRSADARVQMEAAVRLDATFANGYDLAVCDLNLGDGEGARKVFTEMLRAFGDTPGIHMDFGQAYSNSDFQADAVEEFKKAIAEDGHLPGAHYSLAVAYLATAGNARLGDAEAELRKEIANNPKNAEAYAALGHLLATHGETAAEKSEAAADLRHATELDATDPDAFLYLGQLYADEKQTAAAKDALRRSIALTKDVSRNGFQVQKAHYLLGRLLLESGDKVEGAQELAASQESQKQNLSRDQSRLSEYLGEKRSAGPASDLARPQPRASGEPPADARAGVAVAAFEKEITPAVADSYNNLGAIAGSEHNYAVALTYFGRAAEWQPALPGLDFNWGRAAFAAGDYGQAIAPLSRYLKLHPEEEGARRVLGLAQFLTNDYAAARATLEPLAAKPDEAPQVRFAYADSLLKTGDWAGAVARLEALYQGPTVPAEVRAALAEGYGGLARQQMARGETKEAVVNFNKALRLDPQNAGLRASLAEASRK